MANHLAALICVAFCLVQINALPEGRISGGTPGSISQAPYLVNIRRNGEVVCTGTLVTQQHVVTAAHCVRPYTVNQLVVVGGQTYISEQGVRRNVAKLIFPSAFNATTNNFDVAVLKLQNPLTGTNIQPIALCNQPGWQKGDLVRVHGWGILQANSVVAPDRFRTVQLPLWSKQDCSQSYAPRQLTESMFCAGGFGNQEACRGDDGAPAIYNNQFCGIASFGLNCASTNRPSVFTNVNIVKTFINNAINNN